MRKFILTSPHFSGNVTFGYNDLNRLILYDNASNMNEKQLDWTLAKLPQAIEQIEPISAAIKGTITEVPEDLTFERFWVVYDKKINRKRAEPLFEKLSDADKMQTIMRIKTYQEYCTFKGRGIADPEKYIRDRYFETNWSKEK